MSGPDDPRRYFADNVARLQRERGLSDADLAARAKLESGDLEAILRAESGVGVDAIFLLAGALGVAPAGLLDGLTWVPGAEGGGDYRVEEAGGD